MRTAYFILVFDFESRWKPVKPDEPRKELFQHRTGVLAGLRTVHIERKSRRFSTLLKGEGAPLQVSLWAAGECRKGCFLPLTRQASYLIQLFEGTRENDPR
jgi:hypothetical protein